MQDAAAGVVVAHGAEEDGDRSFLRPLDEGEQGRKIERLALQPDLDRPAGHPPLTGGRNATSSSGASFVSRETKSWLTAKLIDFP